MSKVAELEAEIAYERLAEKRAADAAAAERRAAEQARKAAEAQFTRQVADLEKSVPAILDTAAQLGSGGIPPLAVRSLARQILSGAHEQIGGLAHADPAFSLLNAKVGEAQIFIAHHLEVNLGSDHVLCQRGAAVECALWRAFTGRLREVAGEV